MRVLRWSKKKKGAALVLALSLIGGGTYEAVAQFQLRINYPQWMLDSDICGSTCDFVDPSDSNIKIAIPLQNRYLSLFSYDGTTENSKFSLWTNAGDPLNSFDDYPQLFFALPIADPAQLASPWSDARLWCSNRTSGGQDRPFGDITTIRLDDSASATGFRDIDFPGPGVSFYSPSRVDLPRGQGYFHVFGFENNTLEITRKVQFARDLMRVETEVTNVGGSSRRVGMRLLLNPFHDADHVFVPESRERIFYEKDFGQATGTGVNPPRLPDDPTIPSEFRIDSGDFRAKIQLRGSGATVPTRVVVGNSINMYSQAAGTWDYSIAFQQELRISDTGFLCYYDPITVPAGQRRSFVAYIGMGVASHITSNAYNIAQGFTPNIQTQGYIGAVQMADAAPLVNGNADVTNANDPTSSIGIPVDAYMQNEFHTTNINNAFAFIEFPEALQFASSSASQSQRVNLGNLSPVGGVRDEASARWTLQVTGTDAGLVPITVSFNHGFDDAARATRTINVPQGSRYQVGPGKQWRYLTMPFSYTNNADDPADVLGQAPGTFQVIRYNPQINQYEAVNRVVAGEAYWVRSLNLNDGENRFIRLQQAQPIKLATDDTFVSRMVRGWNQMGNPSAYAIPVREVRFLGPGGVLLTYDQAVTQNLIRRALFQYNRKTGVYEQLTATSVIQPGRGVWVFSNLEQAIVWRAPSGSGVSITP
jgi:hypothetical protein